MKKKSDKKRQVSTPTASDNFAPFAPIMRLLGFEENKSVLHGCINLLAEYANSDNPDVAQFLLAKLHVNKDDLIDLLADMSAGKGAKSGANPAIDHLMRTISATFSNSGLIPAKSGLDIGDALRLARTIKKISAKQGQSNSGDNRAVGRPSRQPLSRYDLDDEDYSFF